MATKKNVRLTKQDKFSALRELVLADGGGFEIVKADTNFSMTAEEMADFIQNEIDLLVKKNAAERKPDVKKIAADRVLMDIIVEVLDRPGKLMRISEIQKESVELAELSNQKMSFLLSALENSGEVRKTVEKRKSYYELVGI